MDDLISRKKALDMIRLYERDEDIDIDELESSIAMLPSEQSKTQLSTEDTTLILYKFCPNCGADMRGEQNE